MQNNVTMIYFRSVKKIQQKKGGQNISCPHVPVTWGWVSIVSTCIICFWDVSYLSLGSSWWWIVW